MGLITDPSGNYHISGDQAAQAVGWFVFTIPTKLSTNIHNLQWCQEGCPSLLISFLVLFQQNFLLNYLVMIVMVQIISVSAS